MLLFVVVIVLFVKLEVLGGYFYEPNLDFFVRWCYPVVIKTLI